MSDQFILGIHGFSADSERTMHNSGVSLIKNGRIHFAMDEERFTRKKNEGVFPAQALTALYKETGIKPEQISHVGLPDRKPVWQLKKIIKYIIKTYLETGVFANNYLIESLKRTFQLKRTLPKELHHCKVSFVEHHLAHAASAYYTSPWNRATIITIDGMGDFSMSGIVGIGDDNKIQVHKRLNGFYSPGLYYMIITEILGFISGRHEGKVTGLAAFGKHDEKLETEFNKFLRYNERNLDFYSKNVAFEINDYISKYWVNGYNPNISSNKYEEKDYNKNKRQQLSTFRSKLTGYSKEDIAFAAQYRLEKVVITHIREVIKKTGIRNVCLAGGVFANVKLNQKIRELEVVDNIYVFPAMNDSGLSVGAAIYYHYDLLNNRFHPEIPDNFNIGNSYSDHSIKDHLNTIGIKFTKPEKLELHVANALSKGLIVAHYNGKCEYGPRALGNRSILVEATKTEINASLNIKLNRTEFMPFAPLILKKYANDLLMDWNEDHYNSKFMTVTYNVTEKMKEIAPASVHIDGTARPQIVDGKSNPRIYKILVEYYRQTGIPVLINTSFNLHEEPIVNSPGDALRVLQNNAIDLLVLNNYIIEK